MQNINQLVKSTRIRKSILQPLRSSSNTPESITARCLGSFYAYKAGLHAKPLPHAQHRDSRLDSQTIWGQRTLPVRADHPPGHSVLLKFLNSFAVKKLREGNHYFWKNKNKKNITKVRRKTACLTWNVTKMGFQLKHRKTLMSVTKTTLDSAQSLVLGRAKWKWWVNEGKKSVIQ